jgi:hypothetical protein
MLCRCHVVKVRGSHTEGKKAVRRQGRTETLFFGILFPAGVQQKQMDLMFRLWFLGLREGEG